MLYEWCNSVSSIVYCCKGYALAVLYRKHGILGDALTIYKKIAGIGLFVLVISLSNWLEKHSTTSRNFPHQIDGRRDTWIIQSLVSTAGKFDVHRQLRQIYSHSQNSTMPPATNRNRGFIISVGLCKSLSTECTKLHCRIRWTITSVMPPNNIYCDQWMTLGLPLINIATLCAPLWFVLFSQKK